MPLEQQPDLLHGARRPGKDKLGDGAVLLTAFAEEDAAALMQEVHAVSAEAGFRRMITPGGRRMSAAMTNCGPAGWVTDESGYRYTAADPLTSRPWPPMPAAFGDLANHAAAAAGFEGFAPDSCLINRYEPGARLSLHQDKNEQDFDQPIVSVSLGLPVTFLWGGLKRKERPRRMPLENGDIVVWGGPARLTYHGVAPLAEGDHPVTGRCRINFTFRKAL